MSDNEYLTGLLDTPSGADMSYNFAVHYIKCIFFLLGSVM